MNDAESRAWAGRELLDLVAISSPSESKHDAVGHGVRAEQAPLIGVPAWTDAHNFVGLAGSQAVVWGPDDFGLAHDPDEAIDIGEVVIAARMVEELLVGAEDLAS